MILLILCIVIMVIVFPESSNCIPLMAFGYILGYSTAGKCIRKIFYDKED